MLINLIFLAESWIETSKSPYFTYFYIAAIRKTINISVAESDINSNSMNKIISIKRSTYKILLEWLLWLIAIHSICFGLTLIILPCNVLQYFGFDISQKFFATQGGVFHLIISYAYIRSAMRLDESKDLIILAIITKFSATIFLFFYYFFGSNILIILISAFSDFLMGLSVLLLFVFYRLSYKREVTS